MCVCVCVPYAKTIDVLTMEKDAQCDDRLLQIVNII